VELKENPKKSNDSVLTSIKLQIPAKLEQERQI
jgi:hypothetical protein